MVAQWVVCSPESLAESWDQAAALRIPKTGMVGTTDLVEDSFDIHPRNKQDIGLRLAYVALAREYGRKDVVDSGPRLNGGGEGWPREVVFQLQRGGW